nr:mdis1-interacting receptor like kinase 2 [Quercus suber]
MFLLVLVLALVSSSQYAYSSSVTLASFSANAENEVARGKEAKALLKWKASLEIENQSPLSSWSGSNPCNWTGISCKKPGSAVTFLNLSSYGVKGTLHNLSFVSFPNLLGLDLSNNSLHGTIPSNIGNLSKLSHLDFSANQFTGTIPFEIGLLVTLPSFSANAENEVAQGKEAKALLKWKASLEIENQSPLSSWSGSNPCNWTGISCKKPGSAVTFLNLSSYGVKGTLHNLSFVSFPNLLGLDLSNNSLHGNIPSNIVNLSKLSHLDFSANQFTGTIPFEIGLLGTIPPEINNLTHLKFLQLSYNQFTGHLPENVCLGGLLENFTASGNHFTGQIPKSLRNCTSLIRFRLDNNKFIGNIENDLGIYPRLDYMNLSNNRFHGELPRNWGQFHSLTSLDISNNDISGRITLPS